ncbi:unnamed protein product [Rotaria sp. Silwood2]|nr:unnamed protein product [Rotaria sp. Silwood2]CAF3225376.1 unnamed protein product [Rotaria sp. Silwood2]CAF4164394.1 unnamed protein product [Rotaria sp. Silwood2]CAF4197072.1 unnamed protein product [Rotaria sp. Silwood2]
MHITTHIILILALLVIAVQCPGAGGGRGGGSSSSGSSSSSSSSSRGRRSGSGGFGPFCFSIKCGLFLFLLTIFVIGFWVIVIICLLVLCWIKCTSGIPSQMNENFIEQGSVKDYNYEESPFKTGVWSLLYHQYNNWHGPYQILLTFDHSSGKVTGRGTDDVGNFTMDGIFSSRTLRIALKQKYEVGTGDPTENRGHKSTIQLNWVSNKNRFEGTWYIQTLKYRDNGYFQLEFDATSVPLLNTSNE